MALIGKEVGDNLYIHLNEVASLPADIKELIGKALSLIPQEAKAEPNVAKID